MRLSALITPVLRSSTVGSSSRGGRSVADDPGFEAARPPRRMIDAAPPARESSASAAASNARMIGS